MAEHKSIERTLDLRGLKCPLPAMKTRVALAAMETGERLIVLATDPMSAIDVPHAAKGAGGVVTNVQRDGAVLTFEIEKSG
jgi:tRNA 2-thiouridine synthesizing protein A